MNDPAAKPMAVISPKRQTASSVKIAPMTNRQRNILGMAAEKKRSAAADSVDAGAGGGLEIICRLCPVTGPMPCGSFVRTQQQRQRSPGEVEPVGMQPIIEQSSNAIPEKDRSGNYKTYLRVSGRRD